MKRSFALNAAATLILLPATGQAQSKPHKSETTAKRISVTCPHKVLTGGHWIISGPSPMYPKVDATAVLNKRTGDIDVTVDMHKYKNLLAFGNPDKITKKVGDAVNQAVKDGETNCSGPQKTEVKTPKINIKYVWEKPAAK